MLFDSGAAALWALDFSLIVFGDRQGQRELLVAAQAKVFVMRHGLLPPQEQILVAVAECGQLPRDGHSQDGALEILPPVPRAFRFDSDVKPDQNCRNSWEVRYGHPDLL